MKVFKKAIATVLAATALAGLSISSASAQDSTATESTWDTGLDVYSSYLWRGAKFGTGAAFQPYVSKTIGGLEIGAWGSANTGGDEAYEMDLYLAYSFDFGLGLGVTDYYFGGAYFADSLHYIEPSISYEIGGLSVLGAYMVNPAATDDGDMYVELGYSFDNVSLAVGAGDGAYTWTEEDGEDKGPLNVCMVSVSTSKEVEITEKFSLPVSGTVMLNPTTEMFSIAVGFSL